MNYDFLLNWYKHIDIYKTDHFSYAYTNNACANTAVLITLPTEDFSMRCSGAWSCQLLAVCGSLITGATLVSFGQ